MMNELNKDEKAGPMKKISTWMPLLLGFALAGGIFIGYRLQLSLQGRSNRSVGDNFSVLNRQSKVEEILRYIEAKYVDEVDRKKLEEKAIEAIIHELDPHSGYISAEYLKEVNEQLEGNFDGIGVEFLILEDTVMVVSPLAGGPSEAAGILAGDKIITVDDTVIAGKNLTSQKVMGYLRGEKGSEVRIGIQRKGENQRRHFSIIRDQIPVHSVDAAFMVDDQTAYLKLSRFSSNTYQEFMKNLEDLTKNGGMKNLVLDLRHNPGGFLQQASMILSQLFKEKDLLLVYTDGRSIGRNDYESTGRAQFEIGKVVVLIDEGSASASEILAGAIQDHDRGTIVGRRSFGKGLVQEQYNLSDGSALRLTVARYYTPSGRSIQKPYENLDTYEEDLSRRFDTGELYADSAVVKGDTTHKFFTDEGRVVYGGGGVMPDIIVPLDSIYLDETFANFSQFIPTFAFTLSEQQKKTKEWTLDWYLKNYQISAEAFGQFLAFCHEKGVKETAVSKLMEEELKLLLKARLAKHFFDDLAFYKILNQKDRMVIEAMKLLRK